MQPAILLSKPSNFPRNFSSGIVSGHSHDEKNFQDAPCEQDEARKTDFAGATASETHEV